jgi:hypothetical protein
MTKPIVIVCFLSMGDPRDGLPLCEQVLDEFAARIQSGLAGELKTAVIRGNDFAHAFTMEGGAVLAQVMPGPTDLLN